MESNSRLQNGQSLETTGAQGLPFILNGLPGMGSGQSLFSCFVVEKNTNFLYKGAHCPTWARSTPGGETYRRPVDEGTLGGKGATNGQTCFSEFPQFSESVLDVRFRLITALPSGPNRSPQFPQFSEYRSGGRIDSKYGSLPLLTIPTILRITPRRRPPLLQGIGRGPNPILRILAILTIVWPWIITCTPATAPSGPPRDTLKIQLPRQVELTRLIQERLAGVGEKQTAAVQ